MKTQRQIIQIRKLTKQYGEQLAVDNISLSIAEGDVFGFLGHNGAGKTTTVSMLTTLIEPTSGQVMIDGHYLQKNTDKIRRIIGYVPENVQLYDALTAYENLDFFARLSGLSKPAPAIAETLNFLGADSYKHKKIASLSKGMRQRIGLAQAIIHKPKILFLDEPTSGLDPQGIRELRDIIIKLNEQEKITVFMNTHLLSEVSKTCKSIGVLSHGRLIYNDTLANTLQSFSDESSLEEIYTELEVQ